MPGEKTQTENFDELLKALAATGDDADKMALGAPAVNPEDLIDPGADPEGDEVEEVEEADEGGAPDLKKSMGGEELVDATDLLKSLMERQDSSDGVLAKSLQTMTTVMSRQNAAMTKQAELIKSLQDQVAAIAGQGRGRRAVLAPITKPGVGDAGDNGQGEQITHTDLMAKANAAYQAGSITGAQLNTVDVCLRNGWSIDPGILTRVAGA